MKNIRWHKRNDVRPVLDGRLTAAAAKRVIRRPYAIIIACWFLLVSSPCALAQSEENTEYPVKLAFLYNFTKFVQWPLDAFRDASAPLVICIVGEDPFNADLEQEFRRRTSGSHPLNLKTSKPSDDLTTCHVAFVTAAENKRAAGIVARLKGASVLTVGESNGFADHGGVINFILEENKVHFEINVDVAKQTRLTISSKLLALGRILKDQSHTQASAY
jgi:YfiR/HmsC-like